MQNVSLRIHLLTRAETIEHIGLDVSQGANMGYVMKGYDNTAANDIIEPMVSTPSHFISHYSRKRHQKHALGDNQGIQSKYGKLKRKQVRNYLNMKRLGGKK